WYVLIAAALVGVIAAFARRNRPATSLLPIPLALAGLYVLFFAEARYHLPIAVLLMPFAGAGLVWVGEAVRDLARFPIDRQRRPGSTTAAATTEIDLPAGKYRISMRVDCGDRCPDGAEIAVSADGVELRRMPWPAPGSTVALVIPVTHSAGGKLHLEIRIDGK